PAGVAGSGARARAVAAMALCGAGLVAGVGHASLSGEVRASGEAATHAAVASALSPGGPPRAAIIVSPPGHEETVLNGVSNVIGRGVPLFGCSVADQQMLSNWQVFAGNHLLPNSVAVALLYGDLRAGSAFSAGYWPTARTAKAQHVSGGRMVELLDDEPAAAVYASWLGVGAESLRGSAVRRYAAQAPLAVEDPRTSRLLVKEPGTVTNDGKIGFYADIREGEQLRLLTSTPESLIAAAGAAVAEAMMRADLAADDVSCVLLAHGAGRALALQERLEEVPVQVRRLVGAAPLLGCSTFGEQSLLSDGRPVHLNLTAAALVLGG
ncbi:MAG: FIST signal transduction protein, partial [Anaerolineae bacterium]